MSSENFEAPDRLAEIISTAKKIKVSFEKQYGGPLQPALLNGLPTLKNNVIITIIRVKI